MKLIFAVHAALLLILANRCGGSIPDQLIKCYSPEEFPVVHEMPPLTVQLLVELLRKVELNDLMARDIRILTSILYHRLQLDGIQLATDVATDEEIIPYSHSGFKYFKYKFLGTFLPGDHDMENGTLSDYDFCLLHKVLSSTLDMHLRGDEDSTCPVRKTSNSKSSMQTSNCPVEQGAVFSKWGTVSAGNLLNGVAAEFTKSVEKLATLMAPQTNNTFQKYLNASISNVWVATVLADLAEELLFKMNQTSIANEAYWNDTLHPRLLYLTEADWQMSSAELLGGIDGLILASNIKQWTSQLSSTRLSQIIDMYYSGRGVAFDGNYRACDRLSKINALFDNVDLGEQVASTALLLKEAASYGGIITSNGIKEFSKHVAQSYASKRDEIVKKYDNCQQDDRPFAAKLEIVVVLDGSLDFYQTQRLIAYLTEEMDVSYYGSKLGVINGQTGNWIVNVTNSLTEIFSNLTTYDDPWPTYLSVSHSFQSIKAYYDTTAETHNRTTNSNTPFGSAIIILMNHPLADNELKTASFEAGDFKNLHPESRLIYVTHKDRQDIQMQDQNDAILVTNSLDPAVSGKMIADKLKTIPSHLVVYVENDFEDYITPSVATMYEIHRKYFQKGDVRLKITNHEYGQISVCISEKIEKDGPCKLLGPNEEMQCKPRDYCANRNDCTILIKVASNSTAIKCAEPDCRYPDQVRINIHSTWATGSGSSTVLHTLLLFIVNLVFTFVMK